MPQTTADDFRPTIQMQIRPEDTANIRNHALRKGAQLLRCPIPFGNNGHDPADFVVGFRGRRISHSQQQLSNHLRSLLVVFHFLDR